MVRGAKVQDFLRTPRASMDIDLDSGKRDFENKASNYTKRSDEVVLNKRRQRGHPYAYPGMCVGVCANTQKEGRVRDCWRRLTSHDAMIDRSGRCRSTPLEFVDCQVRQSKLLCAATAACEYRCPRAVTNSRGL